MACRLGPVRCQQLLGGAVALLMLELLASVLWEYRHYFPPNFAAAAFLIGREATFWGLYSWAFYVHIVVGPVALVLGVYQICSGRVVRWRGRHALIGPLQTGVVILTALSGLVMAPYTAFGQAAAFGFAGMGMATMISIVATARSALSADWTRHRLWAYRCLVLLSATLWFRLLAGLTILLRWETPMTYQINAWLSWIGPLCVAEVFYRRRAQGAVSRPDLAAETVKRSRRPPAIARPGFSLVELLTVVGIIAALLALLLPATRSTREAARQAHCSNSTKHLMLAVLNHESAMGHLPLAMSGAEAADQLSIQGPAPMDADDGYSFVVPLLRYFAAGTLADEIAEASQGRSEPVTSRRLASGSAASPWNRRVDGLICPSFPGGDLAEGDYGASRPQVSNYHALVAATASGPLKTFDDESPESGGMLVTRRTSPCGLRLQDATGGTANAILTTESREPRWAAWFSGASVSTMALRPRGAAEGTPSVSGLNQGGEAPGSHFWSGAVERAWGPSSVHAGNLITMGFADGHVQALSDATDVEVVRALAARGREWHHD